MRGDGTCLDLLRFCEDGVKQLTRGVRGVCRAEFGREVSLGGQLGDCLL